MNKNQEFKDFFEGKMSISEAEKFSAWLQTAEGRLFLEAKLEDNWKNGRDTDFADWDKESLLAKINQKKGTSPLEKDRPDTRSDHPQDQKFFRISNWYKVAAVLIFIIAAPFVFQMIKSSQSSPEELPVVMKEITRANPAGVKSKFQLPDGSLVTLNSESSLTYKEDFANNRTLELIGEAYITVAKDSLHPFVVKSQGLNTRALGTVFNIKAYEDENRVEVLLIEGKVKVDYSQINEALILVPGEKAVLTIEDGDFEKRQGDLVRETQWTKGVLEFRNLAFDKIFKSLERWYGVKFEVKGNMSRAKGIGKFQEGETLDNVLEVLSYSNSFKYKINKDTVYIEFSEN